MEGRALTIGDFTNDGRPDIATIDGTALVSVLRGQGDGRFQATGRFDYGGIASAIASGDWNRDGRLDVVVPVMQAVAILLGNGDGTLRFASHFAHQVLFPEGIAAADLNRDGALDLALVATRGVDTFETNLSVLLGTGDGRFAVKGIH